MPGAMCNGLRFRIVRTEGTHRVEVFSTNQQVLNHVESSSQEPRLCLRCCILHGMLPRNPGSSGLVFSVVHIRHR